MCVVVFVRVCVCVRVLVGLLARLFVCLFVS